MRKRLVSLLLLVIVLVIPVSVSAQTYSFGLDQLIVHVFWNDDGTTSIDYVFVFSNDSSASPIDYVDVGLPNSNFEVSSISADVNGRPVSDISRSGYQGSGTGVAVGLGSDAIQPGSTGTVHVFIGTVRDMLYPDDLGDDYASAVFATMYFGSQYVHGNTDITVVYHLPPGVEPEEPRWHQSPSGWPSEPETGFDNAGNITYTWRNTNANGYTQYTFGASFPLQYVPANAIVRPSFWQMLGIDPDDLIGFSFCGCIGAIILLSMVFSIRSAQKRKLKYLPPKVTIEGHGIKRGLTAVEAAILLEQPMDKILTMVLFAVIKKEAASVTSREPLKLKVASPPPEGLRKYELAFLKAFQKPNKRAQRAALQDMMVGLIKSVQKKMKGFSFKETVAYYKKITERAWGQVEAANTPEVKSEKFEENMEWTMLDRDYDEKTRRVFRTGPVFVPIWWPRYDPTFKPGTSPGVPKTTVSAPSKGGGGVSMPTLPGSTFAAGMVTGVQDFSSSVVGNLSDFTSKVTNKTNPVPKSTSKGWSSGGGGGGCACACACAGCACACAGGGR
ncbi:MAG: hypothetical protein KAS36_13505 [Anaerolineales bacterium]|nr:hypothetical protein [Anaerolineales bacterium]